VVTLWDRIHIHKIAAQDTQPTTVFSLLCREFWNMRKNTKRAETEAYSTPRKIIVGIIKEKAIFL
jgi:hypothetical protein